MLIIKYFRDTYNYDPIGWSTVLLEKNSALKDDEGT